MDVSIWFDLPLNGMGFFFLVLSDWLQIRRRKRSIKMMYKKDSIFRAHEQTTKDDSGPYFWLIVCLSCSNQREKDPVSIFLGLCGGGKDRSFVQLKGFVRRFQDFLFDWLTRRKSRFVHHVPLNLLFPSCVCLSWKILKRSGATWNGLVGSEKS